jgi:hypothetical protein
LVSATALLMMLTEQGRLAEAVGVLASVRTGQGARCDRAVYAYGRGWLRVAQGRAAAAARDFQESGCLMREAGHDFLVSSRGASAPQPPSSRSASGTRPRNWPASS